VKVRSEVRGGSNAPTDPKGKTTDLQHESAGLRGAGCGYNYAWILPVHGECASRAGSQSRSSTPTSDGRLASVQTGVTRAPLLLPTLWRNP